MSVDTNLQDMARRVWSAGDWDQVADYVRNTGAGLLDALDVAPGMALLDVAAGSGGSVAIPAAQRGLTVAASDLVAAHFDAGRRRAAAAGVEIEWVEADALDLPFDDGVFDRVTSTFGHMFAPDHAQAAAELVRVCRPGGLIGIACWTPEGVIGEMFRINGSLLPPPPGMVPPVLWGDEDHVREMFGPHGLELSFEKRMNVFMDVSVEAYEDHMYRTFGPLVTAAAALGERAGELRRANAELFHRVNQATDGSVRFEGEYLQTIARKPA